MKVWGFEGLCETLDPTTHTHFVQYRNDNLGSFAKTMMGEHTILGLDFFFVVYFHVMPHRFVRTKPVRTLQRIGC